MAEPGPCVGDLNSKDSNLATHVDVFGEDSGIVPKVGMKFKNENEVFEFYKKYAYHVGFPIRKRNSKKDAKGAVIYVAFACSREGRRPSNTSNSLKPQPTCQTGCKAKLYACSDASGIWRITTVHLEHNHPTSPSKSRVYRCYRQLNDHVKRKLDVHDVAGIPLHKSFNSSVIEEGGYEAMCFIEKDCRNYIDKARKLRLGEGDAAAIQAYFSKMQSLCPGFFFSLDLDDEGQLKNVFWADNRCRQAYKEFGDIVTFDTTYLTNKYDMPFAPFVGVNHHGHSMLLGCGLLSNEDTKTFVWLFKIWLECMEHQAPLGIITDQDKAMQNAIEIVFPKTKHRWCLWHILKKLPEKFGYHCDKDSIFSSIHVLVYESQSPDEFEQDWHFMINKFELQENDWLIGLFRERSRWVPCFLNTFFWAGMSTSQRSESMNAFFDGYVHSKTSLKQFVEQYERALRSKVEKEFQADFRSFSQMVPCATRFDMEKQFQSAYTIVKFKEFQEELTGKMYCDVESIDEVSFGTRNVVTEYFTVNGKVKEKRYEVMFQRYKCTIVCSCHLFEFRGIICRHAITIFIRNKVLSIPEEYILRRWRKDVSRLYMRVKINYNGWITTPGQLNYNNLCKAFAKVADLVADNNDETHKLLEWIESKACDLAISKSRPCSGSNLVSKMSVQVQSDLDGGATKTSACKLIDPKCSKTKGAPKKLRKKGPLEKCSKKLKLKSSNERSARQENVQSNHVFGRPPQNSMMSSLSFSQQLTGAHYPHWDPRYTVHLLPNYGIYQASIIYPSRGPPENDEV